MTLRIVGESAAPAFVVPYRSAGVELPTSAGSRNRREMITLVANWIAKLAYWDASDHSAARRMLIAA